VDGFLIREKQLEARALWDLTRWCQDLAPDLELWIADRLEVALAAGCGMHAGESYPAVPAALGPLSRPLHDEGQWEDRRNCTQVLLAPVFASPGKAAPWGSARVRAFLDGLPPEGPSILALGGVDPITRKALVHPRLAGFAAIRPFWQGDPRATVARFREA
jgi:thiamine monophosphate synthase